MKAFLFLPNSAPLHYVHSNKNNSNQCKRLSSLLNLHTSPQVQDEEVHQYLRQELYRHGLLAHGLPQQYNYVANSQEPKNHQLVAR